MATWQAPLSKWIIAGSVFVLGIGGCGKPAASDPPRAESAANIEITTSVVPTLNPNNENFVSTSSANYDQSFMQAANIEVLEGYPLPPDVTVAGKKTGLLRVDVEEAWPNIRLVDAAGQPIPYVLHLTTSEGSIEIKLRPELAPNHVRNILSLAKLGFYDGLLFERNVHQESDADGKKSRLDLLIAGCPNGTGEEGFGHIGYFMRSEFQPELQHTEGTVGFWHEENPDSAGCRFYITLGPAPALDGKFTVIGQVVRGLDIVKNIHAQPTFSSDPSSPDSERPQKPIVIEKITITPDVK